MLFAIANRSVVAINKIFTAITAPATPTNGLRLFARKRAGVLSLALIKPTGTISEIQTSLIDEKFSGIFASGGGSTTVTAVGATQVATGTATGVSMVTGTIVGDFARVQYLSTSAAAQGVGILMGRTLSRGSAAGIGGFDWRCRFSIDTTVAAAAVYAGIAPGIVDLGDVDPSTQVNIFGVGADTGDTNLQFMTNDGSGTATKTNLGASFPKNAGAYELRVACLPNDTVIYYSIQRYDIPAFLEGSANTDIPVNTNVYAGHLHLGNRATASPVAIGFQVMGATET